MLLDFRFQKNVQNVLLIQQQMRKSLLWVWSLSIFLFFCEPPILSLLWWNQFCAHKINFPQTFYLPNGREPPTPEGYFGNLPKQNQRLFSDIICQICFFSKTKPLWTNSFFVYFFCQKKIFFIFIFLIWFLTSFDLLFSFNCFAVP